MARARAQAYNGGLWLCL